MKKLMITAALVASLITLGYSQNNPQKARKDGARTEKPSGDQRQAKSPEQRAQMATNALEKKLALTADQKAKVYALNLERIQKMEKVEKADMEARKEQMKKNKALMEDTDKKLNKILTAEQQKSYEDMKKQSRERAKARRPQGGSRNRG